MNSTRTVAGDVIDLRQVIAMATPKALDLWLEVVAPPDRARQVAAMNKGDRRRLVELLGERTAAELFGGLDSYLIAKLLKPVEAPKAGELLGALEPNRTADILRRFDRDSREQILASMPLESANVVRRLLSWPEDTVGAHMALQALALNSTTAAEQAIEQIREHASRRRFNAAVGAQVYIIGPDEQLLGVLPFRALVLAPADSLVSELVDDDITTAAPLADAEDAAQTLIDRRAEELPIVDANQRLLGVLTEDEALKILADAATEDAEKQGGSAPLEVPYLEASPWLLWRKRIVWLLVLFVAEAYTGTVLRAFEDEMEAVVALAFFIPLLIGTGGNTGTQITTTLVRAMGTGQVRFRDMGTVIVKELSTGVLISIAMALAGMIRAFTLGVGPQVMLTVSLTLGAIVLWSALVSSVLPLVLKKVKIDPAVVSAPMIATIVDGTGLMIYFLIAHATLPELAGL
jgi:magnesium transporter